MLQSKIPRTCAYMGLICQHNTQPHDVIWLGSKSWFRAKLLPDDLAFLCQSSAASTQWTHWNEWGGMHFCHAVLMSVWTCTLTYRTSAYQHTLYCVFKKSLPLFPNMNLLSSWTPTWTVVSVVHNTKDTGCFPADKLSFRKDVIDQMAAWAVHWQQRWKQP